MKKTKQTKRWINTKVVIEWDDNLQQYVETEVEGYWWEGAVALAHQAVDVHIDAFRIYDDSGTAVAAQNTDPVSLDVDTGYQLRLQIENTSADSAANNYTYQLQYNNTTQGTGWTDVTTTSTHVRAQASGLSDGTATTNVLTGGAASFTAGEECTDGLSASISLGTTTHTEIVYGIVVRSADVANNDNIDFRVTNAGTVLQTDDIVPSITVVETNDLAVTATLGSLTLSAQTPASVGTESNSTATLGSLSLTGFNAGAVGTESNTTATLGSLSLTGFNATVSAESPLNVTATLGSLTLTGQTPTVDLPQNVTATLGSLTLSEQTPVSVGTESNTTATLGSLTLTGFNASVTTGSDLNVTATTGSLSLTALNTVVDLARNTTATVGSLTLTDFNPVVDLPQNVTATVSSLSLTGFNPSVTAGSSDLNVTSTAGSLTLTALNPSVSAGTDTGEGVVYTHVNEEWVGSTATIWVPLV